MELVLKGKIKVISDISEGTSNGKEWKKLTFVITNNEGHEGAAQDFAFEVFGVEKVDNFMKYQKLDQQVKVSYNIRTNEWKNRWFTSHQAWRIDLEGEVPPATAKSEETDDDLPF